nr:MAG TPA: hypothetical protein [Caudoviricetes sp.]DAI91983.1 MAG TPA: hypothetical protein [Caudoviricetes sp.]
MYQTIYQQTNLSTTTIKPTYCLNLNRLFCIVKIDLNKYYYKKK